MRPSFSDWVDLQVLRLAKLKQAKASKLDYDKFFDKKDDDLYKSDRRMTFRNEVMAETVSRLLPRGSRILDAGCGLGAVLDSLPEGYELNGFDYGEINVLRASKRLMSKATIVQGSLYQIPFPDHSMDMVICLEVLEHIEDDEKAVSEISRVLKSGGYCITSVPSAHYWPEYLNLIGHYRHYTPDTFAELLQRHGLKVMQSLPKCPRWQRKYMRQYLCARLQHLLFGKLFRQGLYEFSYPWSKKPLLETIAARLEPDLKMEAKREGSQGTTFVLAQK